jgi:hypothetical protein
LAYVAQVELTTQRDRRGAVAACDVEATEIHFPATDLAGRIVPTAVQREDRVRCG